MIQLQSQSCAFLCSTSTSVNGYILSEFNLKKFKYKLGSRDDEDMGFMRLQQRCLADWNGDMECRSKKKMRQSYKKEQVVISNFTLKQLTWEADELYDGQNTYEIHYNKKK